MTSKWPNRQNIFCLIIMRKESHHKVGIKVSQIRLQFPCTSKSIFLSLHLSSVYMMDHMLLFKKWNSGEFGSLFTFNSSLRKTINLSTP